MKMNNTMNRNKFVPSIWRDKLNLHLPSIFLSRLDLSSNASKPHIGKEGITLPHP
jgi:hypothetical protein